MLSPAGDVAIVSILPRPSNNRVFEVLTREHGRFYVKFHTASWCADERDAVAVARREASVPRLLDFVGISPPFPVWADLTRTIVPRPAYICGELSGVPVPDAMRQWPDHAQEIARALGAYIRKLHNIRFDQPGLLEPADVDSAGRGDAVLPMRPVAASVDPAVQAQAGAMDQLTEAVAAGVLREEVAGRLGRLFEGMACAVRAKLCSPRLIVANCHVHHFHVAWVNGRWRVPGFYDFEGMAAGDPTVDLAAIEESLVPRVRSFDWRRPFYEGYGGWPDVELVKIRILAESLLRYRVRLPSKRIPNPTWLDFRWMALIEATTWSDFTWYPT